MGKNYGEDIGPLNLCSSSFESHYYRFPKEFFSAIDSANLVSQVLVPLILRDDHPSLLAKSMELSTSWEKDLSSAQQALIHSSEVPIPVRKVANGTVKCPSSFIEKSANGDVQWFYLNKTFISDMVSSLNPSDSVSFAKLLNVEIFRNFLPPFGLGELSHLSNEQISEILSSYSRSDIDFLFSNVKETTIKMTSRFIVQTKGAFFDVYPMNAVFTNVDANNNEYPTYRGFTGNQIYNLLSSASIPSKYIAQFAKMRESGSFSKGPFWTKLTPGQQETLLDRLTRSELQSLDAFEGAQKVKIQTSLEKKGGTNGK